VHTQGNLKSPVHAREGVHKRRCTHKSPSYFWLRIPAHSWMRGL
jgi:hypothetical protein